MALALAAAALFYPHSMDPWHVAFTPGIRPLRVVVGGAVVLDDGRPTRVDPAEVRAKAREQAARLQARQRFFNLVVTNVPGPPRPLYLLESRLLEIHPHVPLVGTLGLGIALFSYHGTISWGFSADWDLIPDLHELVLHTGRAFDELLRAIDSLKLENEGWERQ